MKKKLSLFLALIILFMSFASLLSLLENFDYVAYAEDVETTETTKTAFTVEELLQMGFYSTVDYTSTDLTNIYKLSINSTIADFDNTIVAYLGSPSRYYYLNLYDEVTYNTSVYPLVIMPKYYTYSDDNYNYYSNYSSNLSLYPYTTYNRTQIMADNKDFSSASTMKSVVDGDYIFTLRKSKTTNEVSYFRCTYEFYTHMGFTSPVDIFSCEYFLNDGFDYTVDYYCINRQNNVTPDSSDIPKNFQLWGVRLRSKEEMESLKLDFLEWFEENNKIDYLIANGLDLTSEYISYIYDWWVEYGDNLPSIIVGLPKLISRVNIISWDLTLAKRLVDCFEQLYLEYKKYLENLKYGELVDIHPDSMPHWRDDKTDYTHTTDTEDDTTVITLLREILRNIIDLPNSIRVSFGFLDVYFDGIFTNFNNLLYYLDNLPFYIADELEFDFDFGDEFKLIFVDLQNGIKSDLEYLLIPTAEPFTELKDEIYLKLPVLNQLSGLPNFDGYLETDENIPETLSVYGSVSNDKTLSMFNVSFYDTSIYNGISFDIVDFTKWQKAIEAFKGICSVVIIFHFVHWLIAFIPKLLSGYNSSN